MAKRPKRNPPDYLFLFLTVALTAFGLLMVYSASSMVSTFERNGDSLYYTIKQAIAVILGFVLMIFFMNLSYTKLRKLVFLFWIGTIGLLMLVLLIGNGDEKFGARSWIDLGLFNLQPSELAKLAIVLYLAVVITNKGDKLKQFKKGLFPCLVIVGITSGLILLQPDFGSAAILILGAFAVLWAGGMRNKHLFTIGGIAGVVMTFYMFLPSLLHPEKGNYRLERFHTLRDPWIDPLKSGYQMINSLYAFGHGGFTGTGIGNSIQKQHFLTQSYSDFIFAIIGEELGFLKAALFLLVYVAFIWRGILISLRNPDKFASLSGVGIMMMMGIQALINLLGVTNTIPMTGVTLPLISYGGSSILVTLMSLGIVLGISREQTVSAKSKAKTPALRHVSS
ncbi:putative lipid II flippase FtsW [Gorillibacterium timonense]|uniref:putative lipid II flippase FtsW n=1 Tax=Gorillibacterium timonense TaxID=1689269 RepID=UPI00071CBC9E|nr:putative lipid II flippase FtsW [Gorillibacterium timonense]